MRTDVERILDEVQSLYLSDPMPWIVGYSGGKDSTACLQLIWTAISRLPGLLVPRSSHVVLAFKVCARSARWRPGGRLRTLTAALRRAPRGLGQSRPSFLCKERPMTTLFTDEQLAQLLDNGRHSAEGEDIDPRPVVKLFTPDGTATWLLTEIDPDDQDQAFGLCDVGCGLPELGWVSLEELRMVHGRLGLSVELDQHFTANKVISAYAREARLAGRVLA